MPDTILELKSLCTEFHTRAGVVKAADGVSLSLQKGETLAMVGESGSGKSVTGLSIMRLVPPPGRIVSGQINFNARNLLSLADAEMRAVRGRQIAMIFQDPMTSLNPVFTIGEQIAESIRLHLGLSAEAALTRAADLLDKVQMPAARRRLGDYPHQMSGGMRQRVMIAMALACDPVLIIADEPTTALDVTIQAEILALLRNLKDEFHLSMILITHDLGVVAETADRVAVMYAGRIVEEAGVLDLFGRPRHPYTEGLLLSIPRLAAEHSKTAARLHTIPGTIPNLLSLPAGCAFAPRCDYVLDECRLGNIELSQVAPDRWARCIRSESVGTANAAHS